MAYNAQPRLVCPAVLAQFGTEKQCILILYVAGYASPEEARWLDQHTPQCAECTRRLRRLREQLVDVNGLTPAFQELAAIVDPTHACPIVSARLANEWLVIGLFVASVLGEPIDPALNRWFNSHLCVCADCRQTVRRVGTSAFIRYERQYLARTADRN